MEHKPIDVLSSFLMGEAEHWGTEGELGWIKGDREEQKGTSTKMQIGSQRLPCLAKQKLTGIHLLG
jgi:hypothetical protein